MQVHPRIQVRRKREDRRELKCLVSITYEAATERKGLWCNIAECRIIAGMTSAASVEDLFKGRQFDQEKIVLCVRWYLRYKLSTRDLVEMMAERGVVLVHTTILRWVRRYAPEFEKA